jgi:hypothetical protein
MMMLALPEHAEFFIAQEEGNWKPETLGMRLGRDLLLSPGAPSGFVAINSQICSVRREGRGLYYRLHAY